MTNALIVLTALMFSTPAEVGAERSTTGEAGILSWADSKGYEAYHHEPGNVFLFLAPSSEKSLGRKKALIEKTLAAAEPILPGVSTETEVEPVYVFEVRDLEEGADLRGYLASRHAYFDARPDQELVGFVCGQPFLGAWAARVPGQEEWNPHNELVNRLTQLLVLRRFGTLPFWLEMGLAWNVEADVLGNVYCFPWRAGFVSASEHTGWHREVKKLISKRKMRELDLGLLAAWPRNTYDADLSRLAWDVVRYLSVEHEESLPGLLRAIAELHEANRWIQNDDGSETTDPTYELPAETQLASIAAVAGESFAADIIRWLRKQKK